MRLISWPGSVVSSSSPLAIACTAGTRRALRTALTDAAPTTSSGVRRALRATAAPLTAADDRWSRINGTLRTLGRWSSGTNLTPYYDTGDAYRAMWKAVDEAQTKVVWHTYICKDDVVGNITINKLLAAKKRGVDVELLYDSGGNITGRGRLTANLVAAGARVIQYRPFHQHFLRYFAAGMQWTMSPGLRTHRKVLLVDDKIAFIGGLNVGDDYAAKSVGGNGRFRDTMCAIEGADAIRHVREVCNDTIENQEGAAAHPSLRQRWRQWARRVAPMRLRAKLLVAHAPRFRRARAVLKRQVDLQRRVYASLRQRAREVRGRIRRPRPLSLADRANYLVSRVRGTLPTAASNNAPQRVFEGTQRRVQRVIGACRRLAAPARARRDAAIEAGMARIRSRSQQQPAAACSPEAAHPAVDSDCHEEGLDSTDVNLCRPSRVDAAQVLMCNPHTRDWSLQRALWIVTREAEHRLWITTPYFLPNVLLFRAVLRAARHGVDVRIVAGSYNTTDPWFMWYTSQYVRHKLLDAGVKLYEFEGGQIMHAKTAVVDSRWASIGSYNWDILSNKLLEASVAADDVRFARTMEEHFLKDLSMSRQVTHDDLAQRSLIRRVLCVVFYYGVWFFEKLTFFNYRDRDLHSPFEKDVSDVR